MKKLFALVLCLVLFLPALTAHAACSVSVSASTVSVGDTVKVTFTFKESKAVGSADLTVTFDTAHLEYKSYSGSLGNSGVNVQGGTIIISEYNSGNTSSTYTAAFTFTAKAVGSTTVRITSSDISDQDFVPIDTASASATVTVKAKTSQNLSSNCNLTSLTPPKGCTLSPKFAANTTSYTCSVPYSVEKFPLDWELADKNATAQAIGAITLKVGTNTRSVRVTAQDGTTKTYTVTITRAADTSATPVPTPVATAQPDIPVTVGQKSLSLSRTLHTALPDGFLQEAFAFGDDEVESGVMGSLRVVQLNDGEEFGLYLYDEVSRSFSPYYGLETTGEVYTVLDKTPARLPAGSEKTSVNDLPCWTIPSLGEGYYLVTALRHSTGKEFCGVYCAEDGTVQTASGTLFGDAPATAALTGTTPAPTTSAVVTSTGEPDWVLVNALVIAAVVLIAAIVGFVIILLRGSAPVRRPRKQGHDWGLDDPYDITLEDNAPLAQEPAPAPAQKEDEDDFE